MRRLFIGTFLLSFTLGISGIILPLYAKSLGASYTEIGLLGVAYIALGVVFSVPIGRVSDSRGRRWLMIIGFFTTATALTLYSLAYAVPWLIAIRLFQGFTETLIWINLQGAVADSSSISERGKAMGSYGRSWGLGLGLGPIMGGLMYASIGGPYTFLLNGVVAFVSAAIVMTIHFPKPKLVPQKTEISGIYTLCLAGLIYLGTIAIVNTILPVYTTTDLGLSAFQAGSLLTLFAFVRAIVFTPFGKISDRVGHRPTILTGIIGSSLALACFAVVSNPVMIAVVLVLLAMSAGAIYPSVMSGISKVGGGNNMGYFFGMFNAITSIGWGVFPGVGGVLADAYGPTSPFLMSGLFGLVSVIILWKLLPKD